MEILTKTEKVFESSSSCPGCGSLLGLKMLLQSVDDLKNVVLVTSPGEIALMAKHGLRVHLINSRNPAATARGIAAVRKDLTVIAYAGDVYTESSLPSLLNASENFLYVCYNNTCYVDNGLRLKEFTKSVAHKTAYAAAANVAYYEDFIAKLRKAFSISGFKFIDLLTPCPVLWRYEPSNTVEIGRMATETSLWPLYEITDKVSVTKIPPQNEPVQRYLTMLKASLPEGDLRSIQEKVIRNWRNLHEGKLV